MNTAMQTAERGADTNTANGSFGSHLNFERDVLVGQEVEVRWTNSFRYYRAVATVVKLNSKSIRVTVTRACKDGEAGGYLAGRTLSFPRLYNGTWSANNGVFPMPGKARCACHDECKALEEMVVACLAAQLAAKAGT